MLNCCVFWGISPEKLNVACSTAVALALFKRKLVLHPNIIAEHLGLVLVLAGPHLSADVLRDLLSWNGLHVQILD